MKRILFLLPCLLLHTGCKSISTKSTTDFFDPQGKRIAQHTERTASRGLFVKSDSVKVQATITNLVNAPGPFSLTETKVFGADQIRSEAQADALQAAGEAGGNVIGAAVKAATGTP